jgi:hypothetical protein
MLSKRERITSFFVGIGGVIGLYFWSMFVYAFFFGGLWEKVLDGPQVGFFVALCIIFLGGVLIFFALLCLIAAFVPSNNEK